MKSAQITRIPAPPPDAKRWSSETLPEICDSVPDAKGECNSAQESRGAGTRSCASVRPLRWQRGRQQVQRRKRAAAGAEVRTGAFWTSTPPFSQTDRSFDVSRRKVGKVALGAMSCENPRSTKFSSNCVSDVPQVGEVPYALFSRKRQNRRCPDRVLKKMLCPGNSASPWLAASCCRGGSLAVIQPLWVQKTAEESVLILYLRVTHIRPSKLLEEKEGSCPVVCATYPMPVSRDQNLRSESIYQGKSPRWSVLMYQTRHSGASIDRGRGFRTNEVS